MPSSYLFLLELKEELFEFFRYKDHFDFFLKLKNYHYLSKKKNNNKIPLSKIIDELNNNTEDVELYDNYKGKLMLYQKKNFDIFCRGKKKLYVCPKTRKIFDEPEKNRIETTLCQLNFFKFLFCERVLEKLNITKKHQHYLKKKKTTNNIYFDYSLKEFQPVNKLIW